LRIFSKAEAAARTDGLARRSGRPRLKVSISIKTATNQAPSGTQQFLHVSVVNNGFRDVTVQGLAWRIRDVRSQDFHYPTSFGFRCCRRYHRAADFALEASYTFKYLSTGTREIVSPIRSSGRSSSFLKRTHDFPMSSFFPLSA